MLDLSQFHTHELERIAAAPGTPPDERTAILQEVQTRQEAQQPRAPARTKRLRRRRSPQEHGTTDNDESR